MPNPTQIYNPLALDTNKDKPTFTNTEGVKWWLVALGSHMNGTPNDRRDGAVYRTLRPSGEEDYVVIHEDAVQLVTGNLEQAFFKLDTNYLTRPKS